MNQEEQVVQEEGVSTPSPVSQPISYARQNRAERLKQAAIEPDFVKQKVYSTDEILKDYVTNLDQSEIDEIVRSSGIKGSLGEQAAVAVQNALMSYNSMTEYNTLSGGNTINYFTGNNIGDEWRDMGYEAMLNRKELMEINEESVGGVRSWLAKLAGGATSMGQMALEGFATGGILPMTKMALESYGEGTFNDLKKYADEHEGSLEGYEPKGVDLAINTANGFVQAYIERKLGVASPRFLTGWSRGFWKEGVGGVAQEFLQSEAEELAEVAKGNMEVSELLDNVLDNLIDATVAFPLQGALGAVSNGQHRKRADAIMARARAISRGVKEPTKEDYDFAKKINDAKERELISALTTEFKSAFDETTGEGKLQKKIAGEIKRAVEAKELDLDTANETELAQRIEQIATQETLTAIEDALEKGKSVSELALNNIVYKDGAIWLEGLTPELGDKAVGYARVLAERQSGLAEARNQLDAINAEIKQTKADLVQAQQEKQESRVKVLQARIAKQNALAEKNRIRAEKLEVQTAKLEKQIAKQTEQVKVAEPVKTEKVSAEVKPVEAPKVESPKREVLAQVKKKEPVTERKSLKEERVEKKKTKAEKETEQKLADVYNKIMAQAKQVAKKQLSEISQEEKAQANKTTYADKGEFFSKRKGDVYIRIIPQIDDVTNTYVVKYQTYARNTDIERISNNLGNYTGEFRLGSAGWGQRELADTKERLEKIVNKMINDFGEEYAFFDMEHTDDSLKYLAEGHQQEEPEALKYKNQELRDLEQQGFEEQYKIKTGKDWEKTTTSVDEEGLLHQEKTVKEYTGETINVDGKERTVYNSNGDRIAKSKEALTNFWRWFGDSKVVDEQGRPLVVYHGALGHANLTEISPEYGFNVKAVYTSDNKNISTHYAQSSYIKRNIPNIKNKIADAKSVEDVVEILKNYGKDVKVIESFTDDKGAYYRLDTGLSSETLGYKTSDTEYETSGGLKINLLEKLKKYATRIATESETSDLYPLYLSLQNPLIVDANKKSFWKIDFEGKTTNTETIVETAKERNYDGVIVKNVYETDYENVLGNDYIAFKSNQIKSVDNRGTFGSDTGNILKQGSVSGKGDTNRGGYDEQLKRIILGEKSDLSTIQHEFAHYWMQNNFKWARSGLASQDWLRRWRDVEEWLGVEPQDRLLSKSASEKFAKAYERYILEGKVAPELQWAFEGFQKAYQDIYSELENEYFDLSEELAPEVVDWFNRNKEQSPKRLLEADTKKIEKQIALSAGASVIEDVDGNVIMTEQNKEGDPVVYMGVKESEIPAGDNLLVQADKTTASKLQQSAKRWLSDKVEVQQLTTLDTQATLDNFKNWIARDRQGAWNAMMNPDTRPIYRTYLYKAFAQEAMNDADLAVELANIDMGQAVREMGQAIQALDIRNESGFDTLEIMRNIEKSKGKLSAEELNKSVESIGLDMIELSQEDIDEIEFDTECKL